ncbi:hypothetical protein [Nonomuraea bangladeshensis]|uniref:hypothetical protein n=1 Tax=Nonomuraea bangladeshensis TaxID=404385 RepID=UPI003C2F5998
MSPIADRSVTVRLDADVSPFISGVARAEAAARSLRDSLTGNIRISADASAATSQIQSVQRDVDKLGRANARVRVDADTSSASAQLKRVDSDVSRLTGRSARVKVDADVAGALASIALVAAALASLPAVTSIAVGVGALGAAFGAAGAGAAGFAAVAVPSLGRINDALKQQESAAGGAGGATKSAAQAAAEAASRALQLEQAERRVADAQKGVKQAQEDLTQARRDAKRALEDYALSVKDAALAEEDAALSVEEARARLAEVQADPKATELERQRAELNYRQAVQRLEEQRVRTKRLQEDKAEADRKGVEGSDQVRAAQERLLRAQQDLVEAQKQLLVTQLQQKAAMEQAGNAAGSAASKFAELSKAEQALARDVKKFQDSYVAWQRSLQPDVFPVIRSGMDIMTTAMKLGTPVIRSSARAFNEFLKEVNSELKSDEWKSFFDDLAATAPTAIDKLGDSAINVGNGLRGVFQALLPYSGDLLDIVEQLTQRFEDWGTNLQGSPEFERFIAYVQENGPKVGEIIENIAVFAGKLVEAGAGLGPGVLDLFVQLSEKLASLEPGQIQSIATGIGLIFAAVRLGTTLKLGAFVLLAELLSQMSPGQIQALALAIAGVVTAVKGYQTVTGVVEFFRNLGGSIDGAGKSADGAKGKLASLGSVLGKGGVIGAAVAGTVLAIDQVSDSLDGLNPSIDKVAQGLADFGQGGKPAAELLDQLDPKLQSMIGRFETFGEAAARLASDNPFAKISAGITGFIDSNFGVQLDGGRQAIDNLDASLVRLVESGNTDGAAAAFTRLAQQAVNAGTPMSQLKELFPQYAASLEGATPKTNEMAVAMGLLGVQADPAAAAMERFNAGLDAYTAKTELAQRTLELKDAFDQAKQAIADAGGKLDITSQMTDKQRLAVVAAREQFTGYIEKVLAAARAAGEMAGKTGDAALKSDEARNAFVRQIPELFSLAGKSTEAREQVYKLAEGFGLNRTQADKAAEGVKGVKEVISGLKGKQVEVGVDNKQGLSAIDELRLAILKLTAENVKLRLEAVINKNQAAGGIERYAAGGMIRMAAGGSRPQPPHITSKPTVLYGEGSSGSGGTEAYIPYEQRFRQRAISLVSQVASDFGLTVTPAQQSSYMSMMGPANTARVSAPQRMATAAPAYAPSAGPLGGGSAAGAGTGTGAATAGPAVVIQEQNIYQDADADRFAESAAMRVRGRGR